MALNYIWIAFFIISFLVALIKLIGFGDTEVFNLIISSTFSSSKTAFELALGLTGVLSLWLGILKIGEKSGLINRLAKGLNPILTKLFPEIPQNHPALGAIFMNIAANMLGLDNAATPLGLNAMKELQTLNKEKDTASNSMIMFLVLNTSGLTLIPITIMVYRAQLGAIQPTDIFIPILLSTFLSTLAGVLAVSFYQKINLFSFKSISFILLISVFIGFIICIFSILPSCTTNKVASIAANLILFSVIICFIVSGIRKKINVYETFIEGAREGFKTAVRIIPYLVAFLVAIGVFRASGAMTVLIDIIQSVFAAVHIDTSFVGALPTALMKSLSGSAANGLMIDAMSSYGVDSFTGKMSCVVRGASDTTFYILAVYFGSVGISKTRNAVTCGLIADFTGILAAILLSYLFFF